MRSRLSLVSLVLVAWLGCRDTAQPDGQPDPVTSPATSIPAPAASTSLPDAGWRSPAPAVGGRRVVLLTYNVLASPIFLDLRMKGVLQILERSNADVIALQEVSEEVMATIAAAPWVRAGYRLTERDGAPFAPGGQLILSRLPIDEVRASVLSGGQRRTVLIAHVRAGARRLAVATTHMESFLADGPIRAQQLDAIFGLLAGSGDAVLMGDLNFGDGAEPETSRLDPGYVDPWPALRPGDVGYTWNIADNPLADIGAFVGEPSRRLDRILLRSDRWRAIAIDMVGNASLGQRKLTSSDRALIEMPERPRTAEEPTIEVFPSDHYGLKVVLVGD